jgi:microcystin-dependent protein
MSRNGSGVMSIPNTLVSGAVITASDHNENYDAIEAELTNSVAADGQTTMSGPLKAASGTLAAPSHTFGSDTDTGRYRKSANTMADVCGGEEVVEYSSSGISVTGSASATVLKQAGERLVPAGVILDYGGSSAPGGWLLCYGQAVSRTTYADLFTAIGTAYGAGDSSTTFNLPDLRGRVAAGKDDMGGSAASRLTSTTMTADGATLGAVGGTQTHVLTTGELASHTHTGGAHTHGIHSKSANGTTGAGGPPFCFTDGGPWFSGEGGSYTADQGTTDSGGAVATTSAGSNTAHLNVQPTIIVNKIIKI